MSASAEFSMFDASRVRAIVRQHWGFDGLRPLQLDAIRAGMERRDSLVVMPTGGGKSLCYQVPPLAAERTDVVVSPLIALMKDQVDGLREIGYPAAALHSGLNPAERYEAEQGLAVGRYRLIFAAPERLMSPGFLSLLERARVGCFAIDEAHCISHWGHDFRPEYRQLAVLRQRFPGAALHAFTATATQRVRDDICAQLGLRQPSVLVGRFDRPNLTYRVMPRDDAHGQTLDVLRRHKGEAAIVYCISRRETEEMAGYLNSSGVRAAHYHAGMEPTVRRRTQDAFADEKFDVVVATVAFGMGIDRSDVRLVLHTGLPKSIEHYQQETGRAGRDGLPAECVLLFSAGDLVKWQKLMSGPRTGTRDSGREPAPPPSPQAIAAAYELLRHMESYAAGIQCRHRQLSEYFGQAYEPDHCGACDICLGDTRGLADATVTAQKILSCVARCGERFGVNHIADVLRGAATERIRSLGHDKLSTYGLLKELDGKAISRLTQQLVAQGLLVRSDDEFPVLTLNRESWRVMHGERPVQLFQQTTGSVRRSADDARSWEGVDETLFQSLRTLRRDVAEEHRVPPYLIFGDRSLRDMARIRPTHVEGLRRCYGVGEKKAAELGSRFVAHIAAHCRDHGLSMDIALTRSAEPAPTAVASAPRSNEVKRRAFELFRAAKPLDGVAAEIGRAISTTSDYLAEYIATTRPRSIDAWVDDATYARVAEASERSDGRQMKPIFEALKEQVPYSQIKLVLAHMNVVAIEP